MQVSLINPKDKPPSRQDICDIFSQIKGDKFFTWNVNGLRYLNAARSAIKDAYFYVKGEEAGGSGVFIGIVGWRGLDEGYDDPRIFIYLTEEYRGQGIGVIVMTQIIDQIFDRGFTSASISVYNGNITAIRLYTRMGFYKVRSHPTYDSIIMKRDF